MFIVFSKAESRAEFAERAQNQLEKTIDELEGTLHFNPFNPAAMYFVSVNLHHSSLHFLNF